jgi:hypothetical protein
MEKPKPTVDSPVDLDTRMAELANNPHPHGKKPKLLRRIHERHKQYLSARSKVLKQDASKG